MQRLTSPLYLAIAVWMTCCSESWGNLRRREHDNFWTRLGVGRKVTRDLIDQRPRRSYKRTSSVWVLTLGTRRPSDGNCGAMQAHIDESELSRRTSRSAMSFTLR